MRPGHDVDVLLFQHRFEAGAVVGAPLVMMRVEKSADQQVGFFRSTMMRAPGEALQVRIGRHAGDVVKHGPDCERRETR